MIVTSLCELEQKREGLPHAWSWFQGRVKTRGKLEGPSLDGTIQQLKVVFPVLQLEARARALPGS